LQHSSPPCRYTPRKGSSAAFQINRIIFGANKSSTTKSFRDTATPEQLREIVELQRHDKTLIMLGLSLEEREKLLSKLLGDIRSNYTKQLQQH
jgi:hypothetical protein